MTGSNLAPVELIKGSATLIKCKDAQSYQEVIMTPTLPTTMDFEKSLQELEALVKEMENRELSPEASLEHFKRGFRLAHDCQNALRLAEHRVARWANAEEADTGGHDRS